MATTVSLHHYFAIFLFIIYAVVSNVANTTEGQPLTATYPVDFQLPLDVEELTEKSYQDFITKLRIELAKGGTKSGDVPILPNYGQFPHLFDVLLNTNNHHATVRVRRDNLYVRGFFIQASNKWLEFKDDEVPGRHMVDPKSELLPFGHSYPALENAAGNIKITTINYSRPGVVHAVASLSKPNTKPPEQAKALIFMAQMISEAARFVDISRFYGNQLVKGDHLPQWMRNLENAWGQLSTVVQCYDTYKKKYNYDKVIINGVEYNTVDELRTIFGVIVKETNLDKKNCKIKKLAYEDEDEWSVVLSIDI